MTRPGKGSRSKGAVTKAGSIEGNAATTMWEGEILAPSRGEAVRFASALIAAS